MEKSMNSLKAAMVIIVLGLAGLFASCSGDSSNSVAPVTPDTPVTPTTAKATKGVMTANYYFGDSLLDYCDAKITYIDADGKQQTVPVEQSKCTRKDGKSAPYYIYELKIETSKFPTTLTAKLEVTPKDDATLENAKTSPCMYLANSYVVNLYDKDGKELTTKELIACDTKDEGARLEDVKKYLKEGLTEELSYKKMDKTVSITITSDTASCELK